MSRTDHLWLTARADYAVRALVELARAGKPLTSDAIAEAQHIPKTFLTVILGQLRRAGLVTSRRGRTGGYDLARSPETVTVAEVVRAVEGETEDGAITTAGAPGQPSLAATYRTLRGSVVGLLDAVSVAGLVRGRIPAHVRRLATPPVNRTRRRP